MENSKASHSTSGTQALCRPEVLLLLHSAQHWNVGAQKKRLNWQLHIKYIMNIHVSSQSFQPLISLNQDFKKPELLKMAMIKHIPWRHVPCIFGRYMGDRDFIFPLVTTHTLNYGCNPFKQISSFLCYYLCFISTFISMLVLLLLASKNKLHLM